MSSDTLFSRSCGPRRRVRGARQRRGPARDSPAPLGLCPSLATPTRLLGALAEHEQERVDDVALPAAVGAHDGGEGLRRRVARQPRRGALASAGRAAAPRALWKGPMRCSPAYDLKLHSTISLMTSRARGSAAAIAGALFSKTQALRTGTRCAGAAGGAARALRGARSRAVREARRPRPPRGDGAHTECRLPRHKPICRAPSAAMAEPEAPAEGAGPAAAPATHRRPALAPRNKRRMQARGGMARAPRVRRHAR